MRLALLGHLRQDTIWSALQTKASGFEMKTDQQDGMTFAKTNGMDRIMLTFIATIKLLHDMFIKYICTQHDWKHR